MLILITVLLCFQLECIPIAEGLQIETILDQPLVVPNVGPNVLVTTLLITMPPGDTGLPAHTHPGPAVGYVVKGEVLFQVNDELPEILPTGSTFYVNDSDFHVWDANASNTTVCIVTATIFGRPMEEATTFLKDFKRENRNDALARAKRRGEN
ncbi:uncharacterized protein LOC119072781 [Bradysia coprophila]|uniref:uncharacterized protein LOC119072781 n=1 Tax=Bradysia coprophila TaxID=38358 RepID=UPI00187D8A3F|nr:uncharacterized protein LOC119072781 [Bradysia coprophila]